MQEIQYNLMELLKFPSLYTVHIGRLEHFQSPYDLTVEISLFI